MRRRYGRYEAQRRDLCIVNGLRRCSQRKIDGLDAHVEATSRRRLRAGFLQSANEHFGGLAKAARVVSIDEYFYVEDEETGDTGRAELV